MNIHISIQSHRISCRDTSLHAVVIRVVKKIGGQKNQLLKGSALTPKTFPYGKLLYDTEVLANLKVFMVAQRLQKWYVQMKIC